MRWTNEPPTEPGWYWWRRAGSINRDISRVFRFRGINHEPLVVAADGSFYPMLTFIDVYGDRDQAAHKMEWAGPIPEPEE